MAKQITGTQSQSIDLKAGQPQTIKIVKGQQVRIQELINGQMKDAGKVMSSRKGKDLQVKFVDGTEIVFKNFYEECVGGACSVTVGDSQVGSFSITAETPLGDQLPDGSQLVHYSVADSSALMDMSSGAGEFIKTQLAAKDALPVLLQGSSAAEVAVVASGNGWLWGLPLLGLMGGGGSGRTLPDGYQGVIWDTPVSNAIVFRDLNGDGVWDANEPITITDNKGQYTGLNGVGDIVATSLDRLLWRATVSYVETVEVTDKGVTKLVAQTKTLNLVFEGAPFNADEGLDAEAILALIEEQALVLGDSRYNSDDVIDELQRIIDNGLQGEAELAEGDEGYITGFKLAPLKVGAKEFDANGELVAIDIGAKNGLESDPDGNLPSGDDFVWSGTYVIGTSLQQGSASVYITAVSSLVKAYGGNAAEALNAIKAGLDFDMASGVGTAGSNINVLTGELNAQLTRLMGEVIARVEARNVIAQAEFEALDDVQAAEAVYIQQAVIGELNATLAALAQAIKKGDIDRIDLTNPEHLLAIFDGPDGLVLNDDYEAEALALLLDDAGPATYSVWHTETSSGDIDSNVSSNNSVDLFTEEVVGNITMLARDNNSGVSLNVAGDLLASEDDNDSAFLQSSRIRLQAVGEDSFAGLSIYSAEGAITDLDVLATGDGSVAVAMVGEYGSGDLSITGDVLVRADGEDTLGEDVVAYAMVGGENVELGTAARGSNLTVAAEGEDSSADLMMDRVSGHVDDVTAQAGGYNADASMYVNVAHNSTLTVDDITVSATADMSEVDVKLRGDADYDSDDWEPADVVAGTLEIEGDILVTASQNSDANLYINDEVGTDFGATLFKGGDIAIEASGTQADAGAEIRQASGTLGAVSVLATGVPKVSGFDFLNYFGPNGEDEAVRGMDITVNIDSVEYSVSLDSVSNELVNNLEDLLAHIVSELNAQLDGENFHFAADYDDSSDFKQGLFVVWDNIRFNNNFAVTFIVDEDVVNGYSFDQDGTEYSDAELLLVTDGNSLTVSSVNVHAESYQGGASADISGYVTVTGPISVIASEEYAGVSVDINGNSDYVDSTVLGLNGQGASLTVTASGEDASADLDIGNASGAVGVITVTASGDDAEAYLYMDAQAPGLTAASMVITSSGDDAFVYAELNGPTTVKGNITVTAVGKTANVDLDINSAAQDYGVTELEGGQLDVVAGATNATAEARIHNASGSLADVNVTATGQPEVIGFDFLSYFAAPTEQYQIATGRSFSIQVEGETFEFDFTEVSEEALANRQDLLEAMVAQFNATEGAAEFGFRFASTYDGPQDFADGLFVIWDGIRNESPSYSIKFNDGNTNRTIGTSAVLGNLTGYFYKQDATENSNASLDLVTDENGLTLDALSVVADAQESTASADMNGVLTLTGDIVVTASELSADAHAHINNEFDDLTTLGGVNQPIDLTLVASGECSDVDLEIGNASGRVGAISLTASGDSSDANFSLEITDEGVSAASLTVTASSDDASACADINGAIDISGNITVTANESDAEAYAFINWNGDAQTSLGTNTVGSVLSVTAAADFAYASLDIDNATGLVGTMTVSASGDSSDAHLDIETTGAGVTATSLTVTAYGEDAYAFGEVSGDVAITGDIRVTASEGEGADAYGYVNEDDDGNTQLGTGTVGSVLAVTAGSRNASADLVIGKASGLVGAMTVTASANNADAYFDLETTGVNGVTAASLAVNATALDANATAYIDGPVAITGNIEVTATASSAVAIAGINIVGSDTTELGTQTVGSKLTVTASALNTSADLDIGNASGLVSDIAVTASFTNAYADLTLEFDGIVTGNIDVSADGSSAAAYAEIDGDVALRGDVNVFASGDADAEASINSAFSSPASLHLNNDEPIESVFGRTVSGEVVGSNLTVTAIDSSFADLSVGYASGAVNAVNVVAEGEDSMASLDLVTTETGSLTIATVSVDASGEDSAAVTLLFGDVSITGDISVESSGEDTLAYALVNPRIGGPSFGTSTLGQTISEESVGSNITVSATGEYFYVGTEDAVDAAFVSQNTRGHVGELDVSSTGISSDAAALIGVKADETLTFDSLSVTASSLSSDASSATVYLYGQDGQSQGQNGFDLQQDFVTDHGTVEITGNITVTAGGINDDVRLDVNSGESIDLDGLSIDLDSTNRGYTVLGGGNITVSANATNASADVVIHNAEGTVGDIKVTAGGVPEVLGFDFQGYFDHLGNDRGPGIVRIENEDTFSFTINPGPDEVTLTHEFDFANRTIPATPTADFINELLSEVIASFNAQAEEEGLGVHFSDDFDGASDYELESGLFAIWDTVRPGDSGVFGFNNSEITVVDYLFTRDGSINTDAEFELETEHDGVTISSIAVTASGEDAEADLDILGAGVSITGDISVVASEIDADAEADINDNEGNDIDGPTVLGKGNVGSNITVTASAYSASADLDIEKASGLVDAIKVTASADLADADLELWSNAVHLVARSMTVLAQGEDASADVELDADANFTITGAVKITAKGESADADVYVYGETNAAHFFIQGDITAKAISEDAEARLEIVEEQDGNTRGQGQVTLGTDTTGINLTLATDGEDAAAHVHIYTAGGYVDAINVESSGEDAYSYVELEVGAERDLSIESLTIRSITGESSEAEVELWTAADSANIYLQGDVALTAEGALTEAYLSINDRDDSVDIDDTFNEGAITFGEEVGGQTVGSNITVTASGGASNAEADIYNARGTLGNVTVAAEGDGTNNGTAMYFDPVALFDYISATYPSEDFVSDDTQIYMVLGVGKEIDLGLGIGGEWNSLNPNDHLGYINQQAVDLSVDVQFFVDPMFGLALLWGNGSTPVEPTFVARNLEGAPSSVSFDISDLYSYNSSDLLYSADDVFRREDNLDVTTASLDLQLDGVIDGDIDVSASGLASDAYANIDGELEMRGDVIITASGVYASASADINRYVEISGAVLAPVAPVVDTVLSKFVGSNVTVAATGMSAYADLIVGYASGSMDALDVSATGESSAAYTDIAVESNDTLTINTITVTANTVGSDTASAGVTIFGQPGILEQDPRFEELENPVPSGTVRITGDIQVKALGVGDEADLNINYVEDGYTVLVSGDISVTANATDAWADLQMKNVSGQAGNLTVTASGTSEVHGFDFARYFEYHLPGPTTNSNRNSDRFFVGDEFMLTLGDKTLSYTVTTAPVDNDLVNRLLEDVVLQFNIDAAALGLGVTFETSHDSAAGELEFGLFTVWNSVRDEQVEPVISVLRKDAASATEILPSSFFWGLDGTIDSYTHLAITMQEGESLTVQDITVTNSAENTYSEDGASSDHVGAYTNIFGDTRVEGDVTVTASELFSNAEVTINSNEGYNDVSNDLYLLGDTTFVGSDITVTASGQIANANAFFDNGLGTVGNITVTASGDHKMFEGEDYGCYDTLCEMELVNSAADLQLHLNGAITGGVKVNGVFTGGVQVLATNLAAQASATITGLEADLNYVLVKASAQDAVAQASISFDDGVINNVTVNAQHHRSTATIDIEQADPFTIPSPREQYSVPQNTGTVTAQGAGHVGITYFVDGYSSTARTINLTSMNEPLNSVVPPVNEDKEWVGDWGYLDLDLVAKLEAPKGLQTNYLADVRQKMMDINGFNVQRDSINLRKEVMDGDEVAVESAGNVVFYDGTLSYDIGEGPEDVGTVFARGVFTLTELLGSDHYQNAIDDLLEHATYWFNSNRNNSAAEVGYYYREITFQLGSNAVGELVTRSFLVYDHAKNSSGTSGIINLGSTTGLTERNVANRYTIDDTYSDDTDNTHSYDLDGYHAIDLLSVTADGEDAYVSYDLSEDADVMLGDIHVQAIGSYDGGGDGVEVELWISADGEDSSLQLRQSNIHVEANGSDDSAILDIDGAWGTIASINLEAFNGAYVEAYIGGEDNFDSGDTYYGHGIFVRDVRVMAGGEDSSASLDLTVNGFVETLQLEVLGESSDVFAYIDQAEYGGQVFVSGSNLLDVDDADYCVDDIGSNDVTLFYGNATAQKITIDNTGREAGSSEDIAFTLMLDREDLDLSIPTDVWSTRLTIEGWTSNDVIGTLGGDGLDNLDEFQGQALTDQQFHTLLGNAMGAMEELDVMYYFGNIGNNGYLFYDGDGEGVTGVVEFVGVTAFHYDWIDAIAPG